MFLKMVGNNIYLLNNLLWCIFISMFLPVSGARVVSYPGFVEELTVTQEAGSSYLW